MVKRREDAPDDHKNRHRHNVARYQVDRKQVQVLANQKLERVDVDRVEVAARGGLLPVVVLVHEPVNGLVMQRAVEERVEEVIHHVETDERHDGVRDAQLVHGQLDRITVVAHADRVVHKHVRQRLVENDAAAAKVRGGELEGGGRAGGGRGGGGGGRSRDGARGVVRSWHLGVPGLRPRRIFVAT